MQKKIRDIERLIRRRGETEELLAKLAELKSEKKANEFSLLEKKNAEKYHMVKFFERKKLVRRIMSLDSKIETETSKKAKAKLQEDREKLLDDLCYVLYYPKTMKYIAIFANSNEDDNEAAAPDPRADQARILARAARDTDIAGGNQDRVIYAIEVGQGLHKSSKDLKDEDGSENDSDKDESAEKRDRGHAPDNKRKIADKVPIATTAASSVKTAALPAKPITSDSINNDGNDTSEPQAKKAKKEKKDKKDKKEQEKSLDEESKSAHVAIDSLQEDDSAAGDSFFLEEAPEGDVGGEPAVSHKVALGDIRNAANTFRRGSYSKIKDNGVLSKQELRLARWQEKVRNKQRNLVGAPAFGTNFRREQKGHGHGHGRNT